MTGNIKQAEDRIEELVARREQRLKELDQECQCAIGDIQWIGCAWVLPHPDRAAPDIAPMVRDDDIERLAVEVATAHEQNQGRVVESVEQQNRGFDLVSRRPHPEDPKTAVDVRFIEVKGRGGVDEVALTDNEYKTAQRLKGDYWLYVVYNCATKPEIHIVRDSARLGWKPIVRIEHYTVSATTILQAEKESQ